MSSLNKVMLIGNVGQEPTIKTMNSGDRVANFSLATSETWKDKNSGEKKEKTDWHKVVVWGDGLVGVIDKFVKKGDKLYLEGSVKTREYEKDGQKRYTTEIVLDKVGGKMVMLTTKGAGEDRGSGSGGDYGSARSKPAQREPGDDELSGDYEPPF